MTQLAAPTKEIPVHIHDCDSEVDYVAYSVDDCYDAVDMDIYELVQQFDDVITIGRTIGEPVKM